MSDFYTSIDMLRSQVADMLVENEEQTMWVLAEISTRLDAEELHKHLDIIDADAQEVSGFLRELADLIEKETQ